MKILLVGYYGFNNAGDELMLAAIVRQLKDLDAQCSMTAFSNNPSATEIRHGIKSIPFVYRGLVRTYLKHMASVFRNDLLLFGGGTFLQDYGTQRWYGLVLFLILVLSARLFGKKVVIIGSGAGPLNTRMGNLLTKLIINMSHVAVVRDRDSFELLIQLGCEENKLKLGADLLFFQSPSLTIDTARTDEKKKIGLSLFPFFQYVHNDGVKDEQFLREAKHLLKLLEGSGYEITLFCLQDDLAGGDNRYAEELNRQLGTHFRIVTFCKEDENFREILSTMHIAVGMRYHFLVLSLLEGLPVVGISYNPKVESLMKEMGCEEFLLDVERFNAATMIGIIERARCSITDQARFDEMKKRAAVNYEVLRSYLQS